MKPILFALLAGAAASLHAGVAGLPSFATATNVETQITSHSVDFDLKSREAFYHGNVRVTDPRVSLTCERLTVTIPTEGTRVDKIVAEDKVVLLIPEKGITNRATADKATYTYVIRDGRTNEVLELTGSPAIETPQGTLTGDPITWDRTANVIRAVNQHMIFRTDTVSTNGASATTNAPAPAQP